MTRPEWIVAALIAAPVVVCTSSHARADERGPSPKGCALPLTRDNLVSCVLAQSPRARAERDEARAIQGRFRATDPVLPSNPVVSVTGSRRTDPGGALVPYNWSAGLSQEVEIAGQRGARRRSVTSEREAQAQVVIATDREAAFDGYTAFFGLIAARQAAQLAGRLETLSARVNAATRAAADKGLIAMIDSDVAEATFLRVVQARVLAEQAARQANNTLASLLGLRPEDPIAIEGELEPLRLDAVDALAQDALVAKLPEVQALEASRRSQHERADYFRRARWPNPTFSVFAENDETNHLLLGLGLALPVPIAHTYAGQIDESVALADKLGAQSDQARRDARSELSAALESYQTSRQLSELYTEPLLARAEQSLQSIAAEIEAGRVAVRDVIVAQQALMDELRASIDVKLALCLASVRLAKASGAGLEQGAAR